MVQKDAWHNFSFLKFTEAWFVTPDVIYPENVPCVLEKTVYSAAFRWNALSVQFSLVSQSYLTLCDPMDRSTLGFPVHHQLLELTQTHVHCIGDAIQPSYPLSSPSPPALNLSQHQGLYKWVSSSHQVAFKQGDNIQPWCTPFPISNQSIVPCLILTIVS